MEDTIRQYLISGRVQGVGYRAFTRRTALELGLLGWVRNLQDGRVEAVAGGPEPALAEFESRLKRGPPNAVVVSVNARELTAELGLEFEVRKDGAEPCS